MKWKVKVIYIDGQIVEFISDDIVSAGLDLYDYGADEPDNGIDHIEIDPYP